MVFARMEFEACPRARERVEAFRHRPGEFVGADELFLVKFFKTRPTATGPRRQVTRSGNSCQNPSSNHPEKGLKAVSGASATA